MCHCLGRGVFVKKGVRSQQREARSLPYNVSVIVCKEHNGNSKCKRRIRRQQRKANDGKKDTITSYRNKEYKETWLEEERRVLNERVSDPSVMDMFQVETNKGILSTATLHSELTVKLILQHQPCRPLNWA